MYYELVNPKDDIDATIEHYRELLRRIVAFQKLIPTDSVEGVEILCAYREHFKLQA